MDMVVEDKVIVELKAVESVMQFHEAQIISYLTATKLPVGLLINFGNEKLYFKRFVFTKKNSRGLRAAK